MIRILFFFFISQVGLLLVGLSTILRKNHTVSQWHTILGSLDDGDLSVVIHVVLIYF